MGIGHGAWGIGHGAWELGMGHGAWGIRELGIGRSEAEGWGMGHGALENWELVMGSNSQITHNE